jgi:hypothetical protein
MKETLRLLTSGARLGMFAIQAIESAGVAASVIEVVTFRLNPGVTVGEFRQFDRDVEKQHVAKQAGFVSRESAVGEDGEWLVIVHWRSVKDAEASMASFPSAQAAAGFMAKIDASTMSMRRYQK